MPLSLSLGLGLSARNTGGGFSLAAFMAAQADGFWYDFGQTDRLFQEPTGPTPADEPNEVIGLALDQRAWGGKTLAAYMAAQPEISINGDFASGSTGWVHTGFPFSGGTASCVAATGAGISQAVTMAAGRTSLSACAALAGVMPPARMTGVCGWFLMKSAAIDQSKTAPVPP